MNMENQKPLDQQVQNVLHEKDTSALQQYARLVVGRPSLWALARYELLTGCVGGCPGAVGYWLRRKAYRHLFASMGRGAIIGRHVTIRGAERIRLGKGVAIDDNVVLDARDGSGSIEIEDGVLISRNTIIRARNGRIRIGARSDIGANCILATDQELDIGCDVLVAAYAYLCAGGNHAYDRADIPIIQQGFTRKGGTRVEDDVWIGSHSIVLDGVTVGKGSVIGAHSVVNASIEPGSVAWGQPARRQRGRGEKE